MGHIHTSATKLKSAVSELNSDPSTHKDTHNALFRPPWEPAHVADIQINNLRIYKVFKEPSLALLVSSRAAGTAHRPYLKYL